MIIKKADRERHDNSDKCIIYGYPMDEKDINIAIANINGRYPDESQVVNEEVKELFLVTEGEGKVVIDGKEFILEQGDAVLILPNQKYFLEGNLNLVIACTPSYYPEQHREIK